MFCLRCCPHKELKKSQRTNNSIDEKLIQVIDSPRKTFPSSKRLAMSQSDKKKQSLSDMTQKSLPLSHMEISTHNHYSNTRHPHVLSDGHTLSIGIPPYFNQKQSSNNYINNSNNYPIATPSSPTNKTKGEIYQFEHHTEVIYFDTKRQDEFCLRFVINKKPNIQRQAKSILNYVLSKKSTSQHYQSCQQQQLVLVIPSKLLYETKHLQIPSNVHAIFTNMRRLQKNLSINNLTQIIQIIDGDHGFIKTEQFDKIIVILQGENDIEYIKRYCQQLCKRYSLQEFIKIWWVFPAFLSIQDISDIIKQTIRKFLILERVQNAAKYMFYEIDLVKELNLQPFLLVKNRRWRQTYSNTNNRANNIFIKNNHNNNSKLLKTSTFSSASSQHQSSSILQKSLLTKDYQTQICLAMGLLMVEMNQNVMPLYKYFIENILRQMKLIDYMKYRSLLQHQKQQFFKKIVFYNLLTQQACKVLQQNNKIIQHKYNNVEHRRFTIKHSVKKKFIAAFGFQDSVQTNENNTPVQQDWDDQLRLEHLQTRKGSWDKQSKESDENDLNLIDEEEIDNIVIQQIMFQNQHNNNNTTSQQNNNKYNTNISVVTNKQNQQQQQKQSQQLEIQIRQTTKHQLQQ